jgi:GNAT superfamily N-acetyltransferase
MDKWDSEHGLIRPRQDQDLDACVRILAAVHALDGYPVIWLDDPAAWLTPRDLLGAWVIEWEGVIVGHVALHHAVRDPGRPVWSVAAGLPVEQMAVVTRLFVEPGARSRGLGMALFEAAWRFSEELGLSPALEVVESDKAAIALYEKAGWVRVWTRVWALPAGESRLVHYYIAPQDDLNDIDEG